MRLRVFQANDGDCLLLSSDDEKHMLIDGGRSGSFKDHASDTISALPALDVVCVSHIDADHISGILTMLETEIDWRIHEFEKENPPTGRQRKRKPFIARPPNIGQIWHNGFGTQLGDLEGDVRDMLSLASSAQLSLSNPDMIPREHFLKDLALGEQQAIELTERIGSNQLDIPLNEHFAGKLILAGTRNSVFELGSTTITIIGPFKSDVEELRDAWKTWIEKNSNKISDLQNDMRDDEENLARINGSLTNSEGAFGDRDDVTTPNLASIMFLAEEGDVSVLMTGDGAGQDIVKGLEQTGKLDENGLIHVNILKIQHHGAAANIDLDFLKVVIADHYVFCGNGSHHNPELGVIERIAQSRFGTNAQRSQHPNVHDSFKLQFNSKADIANTENRKAHMTELEVLTLRLVQESNGQMDAHFNVDSFFDIEISPVVDGGSSA